MLDNLNQNPEGLFLLKTGQQPSSQEVHALTVANSRIAYNESLKHTS